MYDDIAARIKNRRLELGLSLQDVAENMDISKSTLQRYETGKIHNLPLRQLAPLAKALDTTPDWLLGWSDDITRNGNTVVDIELHSLLSLLGYEIQCYTNGKKINFYKPFMGGGPITREEYQQLKENIYSYIRYNADKLVEVAEKRDNERIDKEYKDVSLFLSPESLAPDE